MAKMLDMIIFGATGFTGKRTIPFVAKFSKAKNRHLTWGIAGRSEQKLKDVLSQCEKEEGVSLCDVTIITADVKDENSLKAMARKARIVINCCGPYRHFGEPVVKACVEEGTHHVDVSGEPEYMEKMQLKYHKAAQDKGVYIISACGVDSIPTDLGVVFLQEKFNGTLNSVVTCLETWEEGEPIPGPAFNYATWESLVNGLAHAKELSVIRRQLYSKRLPHLTPKLVPRTYLRGFDQQKFWAYPLPSADRSVMRRSQYFFYEKDAKRPIQIETYVIIKSFVNLVQSAILGLIVSNFAKYQSGRNLLLKHPEKFTNGVFSHESPNDEKLKKTWFSLTFYGEGWKESLFHADDQYAIPVNKCICAKVKGRNPGYGSACVALALAAVTVITETEALPPGGGVYPPGYAFAKTSLIKQLQENDTPITFEVVFEKDLPSASAKL